MLSAKMIETIRKQTLAYWTMEVRKPEIRGIAKGKEIGHKLADLVDEKTTALLTVKHITKHQQDSRGNRRSRSMGDLWLQDGGIYHPINVKTGIVGREGQPNLVSLKKVLSAVMRCQIDSYYLLIVKMQIDQASITPSVFFVDMLDCLDYVTFDSGPGQMMLKAKKFFEEYSRRSVAPSDTRTKLKRLMELYEDGEERLRKNRERDLERYRKSFQAFMDGESLEVTPETQRTLLLQ